MAKILGISNLGVAPSFPSINTESIMPKPALSAILEPVEELAKNKSTLDIKKVNEFIKRVNKNYGFSETMKVISKIKRMGK